MQVRNLSILVVCQMISTTGSSVMVTLGGIIGSTLTTNKALATLPLSIFRFLEKIHEPDIETQRQPGRGLRAIVTQPLVLVVVLAGTVMHFFGWATLMWVPIAALIGICIALAIVRKDPLLERHALAVREGAT